jgi:hypothetical protein
MLRALTLGVILVVLSSGCTSKGESQAKEKLEFPITAQEALAIVESNPEAREFIDEYLRNESRRITRINLNYDVATGNYTWKVELVERECGCRFGSEEGLNMLRAEVDPVTGRITKLETQVGIKEEEVARERCMEGCHTEEEIASFTVEGG